MTAVDGLAVRRKRTLPHAEHSDTLFEFCLVSGRQFSQPKDSPRIVATWKEPPAGGEGSVGGASTHFLGYVPAPVVHGPAPISGVWRYVRSEIDRRLGRLELLPVVHDDAGFGELGAELVGVLVGGARCRGRFPAQPPVGGSARECGATEHEREASSHGRDAIVSPATCLASRRPVPGRPHPVRPLQTEGRHEGT